MTTNQRNSRYLKTCDSFACGKEILTEAGLKLYTAVNLLPTLEKLIETGVNNQQLTTNDDTISYQSFSLRKGSDTDEKQ